MKISRPFAIGALFTALLGVVTLRSFYQNTSPARLISASGEASSPPESCSAQINIQAQKYLNRRPYPDDQGGFEIHYLDFNNDTQESGLTGPEETVPIPAMTEFIHAGHDAGDGGCSMHYLAIYEQLDSQYLKPPYGGCRPLAGGKVIWKPNLRWGLPRIDFTGLPEAQAELLCTFYNDSACQERVTGLVYDDAIYSAADPYLHALKSAIGTLPLRRIHPFVATNKLSSVGNQRQAHLAVGSGIANGSGSLYGWSPAGPGQARRTPGAPRPVGWISQGDWDLGREAFVVKGSEIRAIAFNNSITSTVPEGVVWVGKQEDGLHVYSRRQPLEGGDPDYQMHVQTFAAASPYNFDMLTIDDGIPNPPNPTFDELANPTPSLVQTNDHHLIAVTSANGTELYRWRFIGTTGAYHILAGQGEFEPLQAPLPAGNALAFFRHESSHYLAVGSDTDIQLYRFDQGLGTHGEFTPIGSIATGVSAADRLLGFSRGTAMYLLHSQEGASQTTFYQWDGLTLTAERTLPTVVLHTATEANRQYLLTADGSAYVWESNQTEPELFTEKTFPPAHDWSSFVANGEQFIIQSTTDSAQGSLLFYRLGQCADTYTCSDPSAPTAGRCVDGSGNPEEPPVTEEDADVNDDCKVDDADRFIIEANMTNPNASTHAEGDANFDGAVDQFDLAIWTNQNGFIDPNCPATQCGNSLCESGEDEVICLDPPDSNCLLVCPEDCAASSSSSSSSSEIIVDPSSSSSEPSVGSSRSRFSDWNICVWPGD